MGVSVSVIIPAYNAAKYLNRAVNSALAQSEVCEIIIVEDGSKDNTLEIAFKLMELSSKIKVTTHPNHENRGLAASRNRGLELVTGDWIQVLDADDELMPGKLRSQLSQVKSNTGFVVANSLDTYPDGRVNKRSFNNHFWKGLIIGKLGISSANLFKKEALESVEGFNDRLRTSEEYDLMFRLKVKGFEPIFTKEYLTKIHITPGSLSRGKEYENILSKNWIDLRKRIRDYLIENQMFSVCLKYHYSGAVGTFHEKYGLPKDNSIHLGMLKIYKLEKKMKKRVFHLLKAK